ncbi:hypothetical protein [Streptomyces sp. NPDC008137]|uniref:SCO2400 family protein n=1 Tax=Streptomyces sp. NPDC008137 TaxID=3364813 RepID=UPI0036EB887F
MDYCSSCRRHLNGALVCPGCGAYAPDIDPSALAARRDGNVWDDRTVWDENRARTRDLPLAHPGPFAGREIPDTDPSDGHGSAGTAAADDYQAPQQGRAARRRQLARWKKNQRRAVVATAVALVGGGLTVAAMKGDAKPGVQAATAPEDTTMGGAAGEAPAYTEPTSSQYETPRTSPTTPPQAGRASRHQQPRAADPRTTPKDTRTDAAATPRELPLTTPRQRTTVPDTVDTVTGTAGSSASKATEPTTPPASETGTDSRQPASPTTPPPAASPTPTAPSGSSSDSDSKPKELCLLVICLG